MVTIYVQGSTRMMISATMLDEGIEVTFANNRKYLVPYDKIPGIGTKDNLHWIEIPDPSHLILYDSNDTQVVLYWDSVHYYRML